MGYYVYIHTCKDNGKKYVGITTASRPERRWKEGKGYWYNKHFYSAILKHGWDNFEHEVFEVDSKEEMYRKEVELISFYHSNDPEFGYNSSSGGEHGFLGCKHSEEFRRKISEAGKERWLDPEYREKVVEAQKKVQKKIHSDPEYRKHMSETQKKVHSDPAYLKKLSEAKKGKSRKPLSVEHKKRISETSKERWADPEYRKKLSEAQKNRPRVKIKLQDGTIIETTKNIIVRNYVNKGKKFEYVD